MADPKKRFSPLTILPIIFFIGLVVLFLVSLSTSRDRQNIPSVLIGKPLPQISLEALSGIERDGKPIPAFHTSAFTQKENKTDQVTIINVWASWCAPCRQEHPFLMSLASRADLRLAGINYKDKTKQALRFLEGLGNPFDTIGVDPNGRAAIELGIYGVPETFIVSPSGIVIHKHVGPILTAKDQKRFLQKIAEAHGK